MATSLDTRAFTGTYPVELPTTGLLAPNNFRLICGTLRKCGDPSDCISRRRSMRFT